ncbi:MAG: hypothetical protein GY696_24790, partial [Gammaproteobacteria bacterium]|nr:hypothetical protein [Gammaproteobacteria bacterium]
MLALLLLVYQVISYAWVTHYVIRPQVDQTMYLIASEVKIVRQQLANHTNIQPAIPSLDSDLRSAGLRLIDSSSGEPASLQQATFYTSLTNSLVSHLNLPTEVRLEESDALYAWVKMPEEDYLWLRVPLAKTGDRFPAPTLVFFMSIAFLSLI